MTNKGYRHILQRLIWLVVPLLPAACSDPPAPGNIIRALNIIEAADISRNEATVAVEIVNPATSEVDYVRFRYGKNESMQSVTDEITEFEGIVRQTLTDLEPGCLYYYCAECGNNTSSVRSETHTFTTEPNANPTIGNIKPLSRGPVSILLSFDVTDDGGETPTSAGCDVTESATGKSLRVPASLPIGNEVRVLITDLQKETDYIIIPYASNRFGETKGNPYNFKTDDVLIIDEAGTFQAVFDGAAGNLGILKISGEMNGGDFRYLRLLLMAPTLQNEPEISCTLHTVDISDVRIVEGGGSYDGSRFTENDIVSKGLFADCMDLESIILPMSATGIDVDAFQNCASLQSLEIPANVTGVLPSTGCTALREISVSAGNRNFKSIDGVLYNAGITEIIWFPLHKEGEYVLPETVTAIGDYAFKDTNISTIKLPEALKSLGRGAFAQSGLREITLPDCITNIPFALFQGCKLLTEVRFGKETNYLGDYVFNGTDIRHLYLPANPPVVSSQTFYNSETDLYKSCILHVPRGCVRSYRSHTKWGIFESIQEY